MESADIICRDCLARSSGALAPVRCEACGSPRLLRSPADSDLTIAHIDCDAFYAAIEKRDDPTLRDRPVIVGGGRRGVVATACYVARTYGIHSAMPMFRALEACPDAVVIRPDMAKYVRAGHEFRRMMLELTPLVEPISIDEAFLDLAGTERLHQAGPALNLVRFAARVEGELGISISVGLSYNKFLAKVASDLDKPRGFSAIGRAEAAAFLENRPVSIIPGVGGAAKARLARIGITLIRHLAETPTEALAGAVGRDAARLADLARGIDPRPVRPEREVKSVSAETTFDQDLRSLEQLRPVLWRLCEKVSLRLKRANLAGRSVTLKLKDTDFQLRTRTRAGLAPTQLAGRLFDAAGPLLARECDGSAFRLIGIGAADLCDGALADRGDLADPDVAREARREAALDRIREKFGSGAVQKGLGFRPAQR